MVRRAFRQHHFNEGHGPGRVDRFADVPQDHQRAVLIPVVDDRLEQVGIPTLGDRVEERATGDRDPIGHPGRVQQRTGSGDDGRQVEQHATGFIGLLQRRGQQRPVTAPDIDDRAETTEIVGGHQGFDRHGGYRSHGVVEHLRQVTIGLQVFEDGHAAEHLRGGPAGLHRVEQLAPALPMLRVADELQHGRHGTRRSRPQRLPEPGQREPAVALLLEQRVTRQRPHQPESGARIGVHAASDVVRRCRTSGEGIEDAEFGRRVHGLGEPAALHHLEHGQVGRRHGLTQLTQAAANPADAVEKPAGRWFLRDCHGAHSNATANPRARPDRRRPGPAHRNTASSVD